MKQSTLNIGRILVWFSCGAASAVAAKLAVDAHRGEDVEVLYCDTLKYEHPDNARFMKDVERWIGMEIKLLKSPKFSDIMDVFEKEQFIVGVNGAACTRAMKRNVRLAYQSASDVHVFGFTADEQDRIESFERDNPNLNLEWVLRDAGVTKQDCYRIVQEAGIKLPEMYLLGYGHNNCIGCVKGGAGYWNKVRKDFPNDFQRMATMERKVGARILKRYFLDELPEGSGRYVPEKIECGTGCSRG